MNEIKADEFRKLINLLTRENLFDRKNAESIIHALVDIKQSVNHIYNKILPELVYANEALEQEQLLEKLWEIREQFRHIDYHMRDANLTEI